ncbi:hypothetical protein [Chondromyces apiculatus]|uniref:hypothetical protein n=1 Tax=Chondromyces apiculatus TaxID=51 RepID=UPI0012DFAC2A|nr:hypothetical protein [Chondromyces apiculatus]
MDKSWGASGKSGGASDKSWTLGATLPGVVPSSGKSGGASDKSWGPFTKSWGPFTKS